MDGLHEVSVIEALGSHIGLHPLVMEDIVSTGQRPKIEDYEDHIFIVLRMFRLNQRKEIDDEQLSLVVGPRYVISFQERPGDVFEPVRERIRSGKGRIRKAGADYLAYALIDAVVDHYFLVLESLGDDIEDLADELLESPSPETLERLHHLKRTMIVVRKSVWPLREVIGKLERGESPFFRKTTLVYLRDVYDHTIQVIDTVETFRDMVSGMHDIYLSSVSHRLNEIMKVLTIIATIFIPLTFIAGIYGMNFQYMPELEWHWGYFAVLGVMTVIAVAMLIFFRHRRWL